MLIAYIMTWIYAMNKYKGETNIWGYTEFGNGQNIKVIEQAIQTK
ncbi:hypothetical protein IGA_00847 [Bacillus cereus HuA3-9]|uniref:Uncharacterized protein n=1 Tax=Bacillus cereus HuA3-9 TaxID=1053205 RepID=R8DCZ5_BACCE|nr:hypothetical protein IGA_00847 [Bacillus cereus HuA3-9]